MRHYSITFNIFDICLLGYYRQLSVMMIVD